MKREELEKTITTARQALNEFCLPKDFKEEDVWNQFTLLKNLHWNRAAAFHQYYGSGMKDPRLQSQWLRILSIICVTMGLVGSGVWSLVDPKVEPLKTALVSTIALALAGVFLLVDRVFTLTNRWMRNTQAMIQCENLMAEFASSWAQLEILDIEVKKTSVVRQRASELMDSFTKGINLIVKDETEDWKVGVKDAFEALRASIDSGDSSLNKVNLAVTQFTANLATEKQRLETETQRKKAGLTEGLITITIETQDEMESDVNVKVFLSNDLKEELNLKYQATTKSLAPGLYSLKATAKKKKDATLVEGAAVVVVEAGTGATVTLKLK
jgi:predicted RecA/RadA family phage recombinase